MASNPTRWNLFVVSSKTSRHGVFLRKSRIENIGPLIQQVVAAAVVVIAVVIVLIVVIVVVIVVVTVLMELMVLRIVLGLIAPTALTFLSDA